jgi:dihydroneopterin aldolase
MKITIEDLKFQTIIGILDFERTQPQDVIVNITIDYTYTQGVYINYAEVSQMVKKTMQEEQFLLLEDALNTLAQKLQHNFSKISTLKLKIAKPSIMPDCKVSLEDTYTF